MPASRDSPDVEATNALQLFARWLPVELSIERVAELYGRQSDWWRPEYLYLVLLMRFARRLAMQEKTDGFFPTLLRTGYVVGPRKSFEKTFSLSIEADRETLGTLFNLEEWRLNAAEGISLLGNIGSTWPTSTGTPLRFSTDSVYVDLESCLVLLDLYSDFGQEQRDGPIVNVRARHFEETIQSIIDISPWAPTKSLAEMRGRTLRHSRISITDIDAIGESSDTLLLVSAKSHPFTWEYARGGYGAVRNIETNTKKAVAEWTDLVGRISARPRGDNFDFSAYSKFVGVVVLPFAPYLSNPAEIADAARGLPAACSLAELEYWLLSPQNPESN
ncbi:hypothetical protein AB0F49_26320 [Micromonospora ureilytica]|uniref:hypothetical protein n=1 Tax=Micromonospora ureilytica TaxID=709868 RepID=UPI00340F1DF2